MANLVTNPTADQTIQSHNLLPASGNTTQSLGSSAAPWEAALGNASIQTANITNMNGVLNAVDYMGSGDIGAGIMNAIAALPTVTGNDYKGNPYSYPAGTIYVPVGNYTYTTGIVVTTPLVTIRGAGPNATVLNFQGSGRGLSHSQPSMGSNITYNNSIIEDITIDGTKNLNSGAVGLYLANVQSPHMCNVCISNFSGSSQVGMLWDSGAAYLERASLRNVWMGNNSVSLSMINTRGSGTTMGYSFLDLYINVSTGQIGILCTGAGSSKQIYVTYCLFHIIINGSGGTGISLNDYALWQANTGVIHSESCTNGLTVDGTSQFIFSGCYTSNNSNPDSCVSGGILNWVDFTSETLSGGGNVTANITSGAAATAGNPCQAPQQWKWNSAYWNGSSSEPDAWTVGIASDASSDCADFVINHPSGGAGIARVGLPGLKVLNGVYGGYNTVIDYSGSSYENLTLPTASGTVVVDQGEGIGNGSAVAGFSAPTKGTGSGPTATSTVVQWMKVLANNGSTYWIPMMQ
jgi:hypothetical protein